MPVPTVPDVLAPAPGPRRLHAVRALLSVIVPPACVACRRPSAASAPLCEDCHAGLPRIRSACPACALPSHGARPCPAARSAFDSARAPFAHDGPARDVVLGLKLAGRLPLAGWMASQMASALAAGPDQAREGAVVVPVPAAPARRRRRGFDPAALIASEIAERIGSPADPVLRRRDRAPRQVGARGSARRTPGRIRVEAVAAAPRSAVLVDDVHTTGATLDACARALKAAGAERVTALTFARSL